MTMKNKLSVKSTLGGSPTIVPNEKGEMSEYKDDPAYVATKAIKTVDEESFEIKNPISGKISTVVLSRTGTTAEKLAAIMLSKDATRDQKEMMVSNWLFENGKENASFLAELFRSKGAHTKESQIFKRQMRFDFEAFANTIVLLFQDVADDMRRAASPVEALELVAERFEKGALLITKEREAITTARMREKGYGVYLDASGKAYSVFDNEIEEVVKRDREEAIKLEQEQNDAK